MNKLGYKVLPHLQLELDVEQQNGSKLGKEYVKVVLTLLI